jgi:hypothetical protein
MTENSSTAPEEHRFGRFDPHLLFFEEPRAEQS